MRLKFAAPALCILLAVPGFALAQQATTESTPQAATEQPASPAPPAPAATSNGKVGAPAEGKGQVVFFRPSKFTGAAIGFKVREGDTELGKLRNGKYFVASVEPGKHEYTVHSEAKDVLTLEVEAGETYYVSASITMGFMAGRPNLSPSDQAAFDAVAAKLELAK